MLAWVVPLLFGHDATLEARSPAPAPGTSAVRELAAADGIAVDALDGGSAGPANGAGPDGGEPALGSADSGPAFLGLDNERNVAQVAPLHTRWTAVSWTHFSCPCKYARRRSHVLCVWWCMQCQRDKGTKAVFALNLQCDYLART